MKIKRRKYKRIFFVICFLLNLLKIVEPAPINTKVLFFSFEEQTEMWAITKTEKNIAKNLSISPEKALSGKNSLKVELNFPGEGCIEKEFFKNLSIYTNFVLNIYLSDTDAPANLQVAILMQDNELLWYQTQKFTIFNNGKWNRLSIDVKPSSVFWESIGHQQPWSEKPLSGIRKIGVKFYSKETLPSKIYIDDISGDLFVFPEFSINSDKIKVYEKFEANFNITASRIIDPFNPDDVKVEGIFTCPDGEIVTIPGFYYQKYLRKLVDKVENLTPQGYPFWKVRFTPEQPGRYVYFIKVEQNSKITLTGKHSFIVLPSEKPGFIRRSSIDERYFAFKNGDFFYPIGLNIRSPTDRRYSSLMKKRIDPDDGTFYYEKLFQEMSENGINFAEIWMAPWFAALEWKENRPGYRGLGYYNLQNAYKLDKILEFAEKYNIFIQLVIINHGQLSTWCDKEWQDNPYNQINGGFLKVPDEFFVDTEAKKLFKKQLRYIVSRWGYSPNIFSWEIINEMNLIGAKNNFYTTQIKNISEWYLEMSEYLREVDVFKRPVTAHYTNLVNNIILSQIIDYTITNGYYNIKNTSLLTYLNRVYQHHSKFKKPTFVSEFGGDSGGATEENLIRDIISGLWYCYHRPFAATPLFWWHRFIKEKNLFNVYSVFSEYISDIDKINIPLEEEKVQIEGRSKKQLFSSALGTTSFVSCWIYDFATTKNIQNITFPLISDIEVILYEKQEGRYIVKFYDMEKGLIDKVMVNSDSGLLKIKLPPFYKWISFKAEYYE